MQTHSHTNGNWYGKQYETQNTGKPKLFEEWLEAQCGNLKSTGWTQSYKGPHNSVGFTSRVSTRFLQVNVRNKSPCFQHNLLFNFFPNYACACSSPAWTCLREPPALTWERASKWLFMFLKFTHCNLLVLPSPNLFPLGVPSRFLHILQTTGGRRERFWHARMCRAQEQTRVQLSCSKCTLQWQCGQGSERSAEGRMIPLLLSALTGGNEHSTADE